MFTVAKDPAPAHRQIEGATAQTLVLHDKGSRRVEDCEGSPSSRSESAQLSTESSKCICDWKWDVSDSSESGTRAVLISPNSSTPSVIGAR